MNIGDLVFDASLGQQAMIIEVKVWSEQPEVSTANPDEYWCLYEDGTLDWAYENELEVINEDR